MKAPLLQLQNVTVSFRKEGNWTPIVKNSQFDLYENEILGIVGESGSGKSVTSLAIMGLLPKAIAKVSEGEIILDGKNIAALSEKEWQKLKGNDIAMIFQEPMSSLNPSLKCGPQVAEILAQHTH